MVADVSPRHGNADLRFIFDVLNDKVCEELQRRGYDLATMRFQIDRTPDESHESKWL